MLQQRSCWRTCVEEVFDSFVAWQDYLGSFGLGNVPSNVFRYSVEQMGLKQVVRWLKEFVLPPECPVCKKAMVNMWDGPMCTNHECERYGEAPKG